MPVAGLSDVTAIAAGWGHSLAVTGDGTVWAWGDNREGQLGDGSTTSRLTPVPVAGLSDVTAIAAGYLHSLADGRTSPTLDVERFSVDLAAGATVTTDVEDDGATPQDPIETTLTTPNAGTVSILEDSTLSRYGFGDFLFRGRRVTITAPTATAAEPIVIRFRIDVSIDPIDWPLPGVQRNGVGVGVCQAPGASPDPCIESRTRLEDGDVEIVVRTSAASEWTVGRAGPSADAGGPYTVDEGSHLVLDGTSEGGDAPVSFRWLGAAGLLDDDTAQQPTFAAIDDAAIDIALLVTDATGLTGFDNTTVTVMNRPPRLSPLAIIQTQSRQLGIGAAFADPGRLDTHTALVRWGDGSESEAHVIERHGNGVLLAQHRYARRGSYEVTILVSDDDDGERNVTRTIVVR